MPMWQAILIQKKTIDIFDFGKVFIPINYQNLHWYYAVMYMKRKKIQIYNRSKLGSDQDPNYLLTYLLDEYKERKDGAPLPDPDKLSLIKNQPGTTPKQKNGLFYVLFFFIQIDSLL